MPETLACAVQLFHVSEHGGAFGGYGSDYPAHVLTYHGFIRGVAIFAAHVLVILALLAYFLT